MSFLSPISDIDMEINDLHEHMAFDSQIEMLFDAIPAPESVKKTGI